MTISRCSNNYGLYHFSEKLIPLIINALNNKPLPVYGKGENVRDWLYVGDHCRAIDLIIHKGRVGEVYNVGGHYEMRNIDIVKLILKELGKDESLITFVTDRKVHDLRYAIDPTKIHNELGWLPETRFEDGLRKTIKWYLDEYSHRKAPVSVTTSAPPRCRASEKNNTPSCCKSHLPADDVSKLLNSELYEHIYCSTINHSRYLRSS